MTGDIEALADQWRTLFGEPPAILDAELMRDVLADLAPLGADLTPG